MNEPGLPFHNCVDLHSSGYLSSAEHIEIENQKGGNVELFVDFYGSTRAEPAVPRTHKPEIVAFGHLGPQSSPILISTRALAQTAFASIFANDRYAAVECTHVDLKPGAFCLIDCATHASPA